MNLLSILSNFTPISLNEMSEVKLMSRTDTKFTFSSRKFFPLLKQLNKFYSILEIDGLRIHNYKSRYFDTDERKFYLDHHNKRVNRNKIRFREYVGSGLAFLEVKLKNNKGRTIKKRLKVKEIPSVLTEKHQKYIDKIIGSELDVNAQQWIIFSRITLVHKTQKERLTIDIDLTFENKEKKGNLKDVIIAEVKQERMSRSSDFIRIAKEMSILPMRLSKYCLSTMQLEPHLKKNRFKRKLLFINKLKL